MTDDVAPSGLERRDLLRLAILVVALLVVTGAIALATDGDGGPAPSKTMQRAEGIVTRVSQTEVVLQPTDGGPEITFSVLPEDARRIDLFHVQQHAQQQLPSEVLYRQEGDARYAVFVNDA